jgi:metallo-beta-lactamase class B
MVVRDNPCSFTPKSCIMFTSLRFCLTVCLMAVVFSAAAQKLAPLPWNDSAWSQPYEPFRVAGNVYYVGTYDLASYLITTPNGHFLINTGLAESVPMIRKNVEALGFKFNDIKILLTNQVHYDHVAGMAEIKKITGARMMVQEADAAVLADGGASDFAFGGTGATFAGLRADRLLHDGDTLRLGTTTLRVLHHPGHTKGSTSFLLDTRDDNRAWKVLIVNIPTILPQTRLKGMKAYPQVGSDYRRTLEALKKQPFDVWVAAHAGQFDLHEKRKVGDAYNPQVFADRPLFEASINRAKQEYERRLKEEK